MSAFKDIPLPELRDCPYCKGKVSIEKITIGVRAIEAYAVGCDGHDEDGGLCPANRLSRHFIHATPRCAAVEWNDRAELVALVLNYTIRRRVDITVPELLDTLHNHARGGATGCPCKMNAHLTDSTGRRFYLGQIGIGIAGGGDGCAGADVDFEISCEQILPDIPEADE